jgi:hypothetical protein
MKRKETTPGETVEGFFVPERSTDDDRTVKRCIIKCRVSNEDTNSISCSIDQKDEIKTHWMLWSVGASK